MKFKFKKILDIYDDKSFFNDDGAGVYCWKLKCNSKLIFEYPEDLDLNHNFTNENKVIYIGKSEKVSDRFKEHLQIEGKTTLRYSLGGILFSLKYCKKNDNYGSEIFFEKESEKELTKWMKNNLEFGYIPYKGDTVLSSYKTLKEYEGSIIIKYQPSLNCDKRVENKLHFDYITDVRRWCRKSVK